MNMWNKGYYSVSCMYITYIWYEHNVYRYLVIVFGRASAFVIYSNRYFYFFLIFFIKLQYIKQDTLRVSIVKIKMRIIVLN